MLKLLGEIFLIALAARVGWSFGGRLIYAYNLLVGCLPYAVSKYLVTQ